jgi:hypothetical protein
VAAENPLHAHERTFHRSMLFYRFDGVFGARRIKTATWGKKEGRKAYLIKSYDQNKTIRQIFSEHIYIKFFRVKSSVNSEHAFLKVRGGISLFAMMMTSHPSGNKCLFRRKNSLISRLILFLVTAFPAFFVTVIPSLVRPSGLPHVTTVKFFELLHTPCL